MLAAARGVARAARPRRARLRGSDGLHRARRRAGCGRSRAAARRELQIRDGFLLVTLVWTVLPAFATLPLLIYLPGLSFTEAYFEAMSGLTATGGDGALGPGHAAAFAQLWRALLQLAGRHGRHRARGGGAAAARRRRPPGVQGRDPRADEGAPSSRRASRETAKGLWLVYVAAHRVVRHLLCAGRHELDRRADARLHDRGPRRLLHARRELRALELARRSRLVAHRLHAVAAINFATHFLAWRRHQPAALRAPIRRRRAFLGVVCAGVLLVAAYLLLRGVYAECRHRRCATRPSTSCRWRPPPAMRPPTMQPGRIFAPLLMLFLCSFVQLLASPPAAASR